MRQLLYTNLLLTITLRFTCDKREICSIIKKSQNAMNMILALAHIQKTRIYESPLVRFENIPFQPGFRNFRQVNITFFNDCQLLKKENSTATHEIKPPFQKFLKE